MINIAEILKDAPIGLKLYSLVHGYVTLEKVNINHPTYPIIVNICDDDATLTKDGKIYLENEDAECVLFPSKEHKSWDNWQEILFQVGDVVTCTKDINQKDKTFIITGIGGNFIALNNNKNLSHNNTSLLYRYATPEEREQFMAELNANGYKWNADTKQMEKSLQNTPKYKVGDYIIRNSGNLDTIAKVNEIVAHIGNVTHYRLFYFENSYTGDYSLKYIESNFRLATEQELIDAGIKEKQFTIDDFKPFDKVLVRDTNSESWYCNLFSHFNKNASYGKYEGIFGNWEQCIPYNDETKHLLGTTDDCPDKYKTW